MYNIEHTFYKQLLAKKIMIFQLSCTYTFFNMINWKKEENKVHITNTSATRKRRWFTKAPCQHITRTRIQKRRINRRYKFKLMKNKYVYIYQTR